MSKSDAKKMRGVAKGRFTRIRHAIEKAIDEKKTIEYLDLLCGDLKDAWKSIREIHDQVLLLSDENAIEGEDDWIEEVEKSHDEVRELMLNYRALIGKAVKAKQAENELNRAQILRNAQEADFKQLCEGISKMMGGQSIETIRSDRADLGRLMDEVKSAHMNYVALLPSDQAEGETAWLQPSRDLYNKVKDEIDKALLEHTAKATPKNVQTSGGCFCSCCK